MDVAHGKSTRGPGKCKVARARHVAATIRAAFRQRKITPSVEGIFKIGQALIAAQRALPLADFIAMIERDLPFGKASAQQFIAIAADRRLKAAITRLPPRWSTLNKLTKLSDDKFRQALASGAINPHMKRFDADSIRGNKVCVICGDEFQAKGRALTCSTACNTLQKQRRANRDRRAYRHEYHAAHREEICKRKREYQAANREKIRKREREHRAANREQINARKREYHAANREQINARKRRWREAAREVIHPP
jgi:hypothetical protein